MMMMDPLTSSDEGLVCQVCGDKGFVNAFVYCCKCLDVPIHRYCLNVMPETPYECVIWYCEQCKAKSSSSKKEEAANSVLRKATPAKKKQKKRRKLASLIARTKKVICQEDNTKSGGEYTDCSKWLTPQNILKKQRTSRKKIAAFLVPKKKEDYNLQDGLKTRTRYSIKHSWNAIALTERCLEGVVSSEGQTDEAKPTMPSSELEKLNSDSSFLVKELANPACNERHDDVLQLMDHEKGVHECYYRCAQPLVDPIWRGSFSVVDTYYDLFEGFVAHLSDKACHKVFEETYMLQSLLHLKMQPKVNLWPKSFQEHQASDDKIALYFFPGDPMHEMAYDRLVADMIDEGLAMRATTKNAELLIFTSMDLPPIFWRFQGKYYLWGVFRGKKNGVASEDSPIYMKKMLARVKSSDAFSPRSPLSSNGVIGGVDMDPEHSHRIRWPWCELRTSYGEPESGTRAN